MRVKGEDDALQRLKFTAARRVLVGFRLNALSWPRKRFDSGNSLPGSLEHSVL